VRDYQRRGKCAQKERQVKGEPPYSLGFLTFEKKKGKATASEPAKKNTGKKPEKIRKMEGSAAF